MVREWTLVSMMAWKRQIKKMEGLHYRLGKSREIQRLLVLLRCWEKIKRAARVSLAEAQYVCHSQDVTTSAKCPDDYLLRSTFLS